MPSVCHMNKSSICHQSATEIGLRYANSLLQEYILYAISLPQEYIPYVISLPHEYILYTISLYMNIYIYIDCIYSVCHRNIFHIKGCAWRAVVFLLCSSDGRSFLKFTVPSVRPQMGRLQHCQLGPLLHQHAAVMTNKSCCYITHANIAQFVACKQHSTI